MKRMITISCKKISTYALLLAAISFPLGKMHANDFFFGDVFSDGEADVETEEPPAETPGTFGSPLKSVRSPRHRDINYCLITNQNIVQIPRKLYFYATPFYQKVSRMEFLSEHIDRQAFENFIIPKIPPADQDDVKVILDKAFPIFERFTTQERKVGAQFKFDFPFKKWTFSLQVPLLASIRNLWVPVPDQEALRKILLTLPKDGVLKPDAIEAKLAETPFHIGFGDMRLRASFIPIKSQLITSRVGATLTVPTSRVFESLVRKTQTKEEAALRFEDVDFDNPESVKKAFSQVVKTFQGVSLRPSLGIGHWGMGVFVDSSIPLFEDTLKFWHKASFDYFLSSYEFRYIISSLHAFPQEKGVSLTPGSVIHSVFGSDYKFSDSWKLTVFYDLYYQCEEHIRKVKILNNALSFYNVSDIEKPRATQQKVGLNFAYLGQGWDMLVGGERVIDREGIGRGWSVFSEISCSF